MTRCKSRSLFLACAAASLSLPALAQMPAPTFPEEAWETRTPAELGMNEAKLEEAKAYALRGNGAGMIVRNGYVVSSWGRTSDRFPVFSVTKAVGSLVLGHAVKTHGVGLSAKARDYYPDFGTNPEGNIATGWLDDVTIEQLATHSSGFEKLSDVPRLKFEPGTHWVYSDGGANWLADVLTVDIGQDLASVLETEFLNHMKIGLVRPGTGGGIAWRNVPDADGRGTTVNGIPRREFNSGIQANVDAMARIGLLLERKGSWKGTQLLQEDFVNRLATPAAGIGGLPIVTTGGAPDSNYPNATAHSGLFWWNNADGTLANVPRDAFWAWGRGDHLIVVVPSLQLVVARTSSKANEGADRLQPLAWKAECQESMCAHYDAVDPFLTPIAQSVTAGAAPVVTLSSSATSVASGGSVTLTWTASAADGCAASGGWSGNKPASGTESVTVSQSSTYTLRCTGPGGATERSVNVTAEGGGGDGGGGGGVLQWWMLAVLGAIFGTRRRARPAG
jgi:CubicO group peptidase (beta-lactamase class C family)